MLKKTAIKTDKEFAKLKRRMSTLTNDGLLEIATAKRSDYTQLAINLAIEELCRRRIFLRLDVNDLKFEDGKKTAISISSIVLKGIFFLYVFSLLSHTLFKPEIFNKITETFGVFPLAIIGGLLLYPLGKLLYKIKESRLLLYARIEILFGIFYGMYAIGVANHWSSISSGETQNLAVWTALVSSVYVVVRGLDNLYKAKANIEAERLKEERVEHAVEDARHKNEMKKIEKSLRSEEEAGLKET